MENDAPVFVDSDHIEEPQAFKALTRKHFKKRLKRSNGEAVEALSRHRPARTRRRHMRGSKTERDDDGDDMEAAEQNRPRRGNGIG